jgi:cytochrome c-type biogenesis protein CcmH/NrfG
MKIKPLHLYLSVGAVAVVFLLVVSIIQSSGKTAPRGKSELKGENESTAPNNSQPAIQNPSKNNVSKEFLEQLNKLKEEADKHPNDTLKLREYAGLAAEAHRSDEAIVYYEKILKLYPRRTDIRLAVASLYFGKQDFTKCEIMLNSVLSYNKNNSEALFNLGIVAATKGDNEKARNLWTGLIKRNSDPEITTAAKEALNSLK